MTFVDGISFFSTDYQIAETSLTDAAANVLLAAPTSYRENQNTQLYRIEAEDMQLENYRLEAIDVASNGMVASFWGKEKGESGSASAAFTGAAGLYDIVLGYFDEEGGGARLDPLLNGQSLGALKLDQKLGSKLATADTLVHRVVGSRLSLQAGDVFTVAGTEAANEHARIDYVEFIRVGGTIAPSENNLPDPIRINAGGDAYTDRV